MNFNPRSREGSDRAASSNKEKRYQISIHAPARGATDQEGSEAYQVRPISIHAPARGATNKRTIVAKSINISIHAPARGATNSISHLVWFFVISIHAPARGATAFAPVFFGAVVYFNPRSREGSDRCGAASVCLDCDFNPRSREGSDSFRRWCKPSRIISIHAPARGATSILSKIHPMFLTISHNASSFSSFPFHSFLPHLLNSSTFCALFQVRISRAFSVYYRFAPKKSTPDL